MSEEESKSEKSYTFAVVPKRTNSPYWQVVRSGCETRAKRLTKETGANITCLFTGPDEGGPETEARQAKIVEDLIEKSPEIDGIALAVVEAASAEVLIDKAVQKGIQVVTFDSDAVGSKRLAYIGTDNVAMGKELGRVLLQIKPEGGTYGIIGAGSPNIQLRENGVRQALANSAWIEVADSPKNCDGDASLAVRQMAELVEANPEIGAIIPVGAWPMIDGPAWQNFVDDNPGVLTVVGDSLQEQIDLMNMGYANALVGQLPFEMGKFAIDKLLEVRKSQEMSLDLPFRDANFPTSFLNVIDIPQDLPPPQVDMNYIGSLAILGYVLFGIVTALSVSFSVSTFALRRNRIVRKSQPPFLYMICAGTLLMGSAIIPLSIDDEKHSQRGCDIACMSTPWLISIGFVTAFSALFSKTWRVNKIFHNPNRFKRVRVTEKDVLAPFAVLMAANLIVLLCWTLLAPLQFDRRAASGTDNWNRVYKSYHGSCISSTGAAGGAIPYVIVLAVINLIALITANVQAYQARSIHVEFSESRYIAIAMASMLQAFLVGVPVLVLVRENPQANFLILSILIFITSSVLLLLIFIPKLMYIRNYEVARAPNRTEGRSDAVDSTISRASMDSTRSDDGALKFAVAKVNPPTRSSGGKSSTQWSTFASLKKSLGWKLQKRAHNEANCDACCSGSRSGTFTDSAKTGNRAGHSVQFADEDSGAPGTDHGTREEEKSDDFEPEAV